MKEEHNSLSLRSVRMMCVIAMFMAITAITGAFSIPLGIAHIYLTDIAVCTAALLLPPAAACVAGGVGAFLGDLIFYPQAMIVTLITRCLQAALVSVISRRVLPGKRFAGSLIAVSAGAFVMVAGYFTGHVLMYGAAETTLVSYVLPQVIQAVFGAAVSVILCGVYGLKRRARRYIGGGPERK